MARNSCACQGFAGLWESNVQNVVVLRVQILNGQPGFQKETLVITGLISNHIDGIKIHLMIVFMDMTGDVRVMVEHIPVNLALNITNESLHQEQHLAERTNMSISNIMKLNLFSRKTFSNTITSTTNKSLDVRWVPQLAMSWPTL